MPLVKLSFEIAEQIRKESEFLSNVELAEKYNISARQIRRIKKGDRWNPEAYGQLQDQNKEQPIN